MLIAEGQESAGGEARAWEALAKLSHEDVCRRARADFDEASGAYALPFFSDMVFVSPHNREVRGCSQVAHLALRESPRQLTLSALWYLLQAKDVPLSGNLLHPRQLGGGQIFARGTHVLPLDRLAEKYGEDAAAFVRRGTALGGEHPGYGDASLMLSPFPRVPIVLVLWRGDREFAAQVDLLLDSTCSIHLPTDIIWSTAMITTTLMLK